MSEYSIGKKILLNDVEEISISEEKVLVRGTDKIIKEVDKSSFGGGSAISVTKSELDNLISNNALIPGSYYIISGVHPTLYDDGTSSGTTIHIKAATTNTLEKNGHGQFWNPKYDQLINGFNIWNSKTFTLNDAGYYEQVLSSTGRHPQSIVVDSNKVVYTANASGPSGVTKILPNGTRIDIDTSSRINTTRLCIDSNDVVYMIGEATTIVSKLDSSGVLVTLADLGRKGNDDICVDSNGNVYVANYTYQDVIKILPNGSFAVHGTCGNGTLSMCLDNDSNIYVAHGGGYGITKILPDGTSSLFATLGSGPQDICFSSLTENLYVSTSTGTVIKIQPDGTTSVFAKLGTVPTPSRGLCLDAEGNVIALNNYTSRVFKITPDGTSTLIYDNPSFYTPFAICCSGNDLYFANMDSYNVVKLSTDEPEQSYSIGDKTIWGGYSWTNNSGAKGQNYDQFTLSYDWTKDQYNEDNYNQALDIIEYDYPNDWISRRYEIQSGCDVIYTKSDYDNFGRESAIKVFQFGNSFNSKLYKGLSNITVSHSYFENINFAGRYQRSIILNSAEQSNCTFGPNTYQEYLTFSGGSSQQGVEFKNNSGQTQCTFKEGSSSGDYFIPSDSIMSNLSLLQNSSITDISPNEDLLLFNPSILKEIYNRPDGTTKIRYYDDDDNLVINDITD